MGAGCGSVGAVAPADSTSGFGGRRKNAGADQIEGSCCGEMADR